MTIDKWFNPYNIEHIKVYKVLMDTGTWPEGFILENVTLPANWQMLLQAKLAHAWVEHICSPNWFDKIFDW